MCFIDINIKVLLRFSLTLLLTLAGGVMLLAQDKSELTHT